jgi:hypothetical protein
MGVSVHEGKKHSQPYKDKSYLRELYHEKGLSMKEVAEECNCALYTIQRWFDRHDIETRQAPQDPTLPAQNGFTRTGEAVGAVYEYVGHRVDGTHRTTGVHRLIAYANGQLEFEELWDESVVVHHKSEHGLDNRPENLEVMLRSEHTAHHEPWVGKQ